MESTSLQLGAKIIVPVGADVVRKQAYAVDVTKIEKTYQQPDGAWRAMITGRRLRLDGTPTHRKGKSVFAIVNISALVEL